MDAAMRDVQRRRPGARTPRRSRRPGPAVQQYRAPLVREFCDRYGLLHRFASVDGWRLGHPKCVQLASGVAAARFAAHEVVFVATPGRDPTWPAPRHPIRRPGPHRTPRHPRRQRRQSRRLVVRTGHRPHPSRPLPNDGGRGHHIRSWHPRPPPGGPQGAEGEALEVGVPVRPHQPAYPGATTPTVVIEQLATSTCR